MPPLLNCRLYAPAPEPETFNELAIVKPPDCEVVPTTRVPAVMAERSADWTLKVPPAEPTVMDLAPLGIRETVPLPAFTEPAKATSLAVMVIGVFVEDVSIDVDTTFVTLPVPSAVMVVPPVPPKALALSAMVPLDPEEVCNTSVSPLTIFEVVMLPLAVTVSVCPELVMPDVDKLAELPVVVIDKLPPTDELPSVTAPSLVT